MQDGAFSVVDNCCAAVATEGSALMRDTTQKTMEVEMDSEKVETPSQTIETQKYYTSG
jgi:hypothetical protein